MKIIFVFLVGCCYGFRSTTFFLFPPNQSEPELLMGTQPDTITNSSFNKCFKTIFLINGHEQPRFQPEIVDAARVIGNRSFNAILVNYISDFYVISVPIAGYEIAQFIRSLSTIMNYDQKHVILFGISLGSHIAGFAGKLSKVGRIMGIDPSGPYYDFFPSFLRLDRSDAEFVDTLHTSQDLGTRLPRVGHVKFVLNGGRNQPGCAPDVRNCSHIRSANFTRSSLTRCEFVFRRCYSYLAFKLGMCENFPTLTFGLGLEPYEVKNTRGERYFHDITQEEFPFCRPEEETVPKYDGRIC